jgi:hypothetical protein
MSATQNLERRIADFYAAEAPSRAPDRVLGSALATIDTTQQRRAFMRVPWRFPTMNRFSRLGIAAVAVIAVGVVGLSFLAGRTPGPGGVTSPTPSFVPSSAPPVTPSLAPTPSPGPTEATASTFRQPFTYLLPAGPEFDYGATNATYWEVRVPEWADAGHPGGLILQAIGGGRSDPCDGSSGTLPIPPGPQAVIDYMKSVAGVTVTDESPTTVDGRPAIQATVLAGPGTASCEDLWLWVEETEPFPREVLFRFIAVDVNGEHLTLAIFGEAENPEWPALADELIGSFRFLPGASPSP